jgi:hypothetical protein
MNVKGIAACATLLLLSASAVAAPPPALPQVTVVAPRAPTLEELAGPAVPNFIKSHTTPSAVIGQLTRWRVGICPTARGLDPELNAFVVARIRAVATTVGAPHEDSPECKSNVLILFTLEPEKVLEAVTRQESGLLGFHYPNQEKKLATMTRPIQGWYVTSTRNWKGQEVMDQPLSLGTASGVIALGSVLNAGPVPPGDPSSRLTHRRSSQVGFALIVVDANKIKGMTIGSLADYLSMLALTQARSSDTCSQLPTVMDLFATSCASGERSMQLTAGDLAFLRELYRANLETPIELEESNIEFAMLRDFGKE